MSGVRQSYGFPLSVAVHSDVGRQRTNNEDSYGQAWLSDGSLFVMVADGMGGHEAGEVASALAVQVVEEVVTQGAGQDPRDHLYAALLDANSAILEEGRRSGKQGMGTTGVVAVCKGREVFVALVGDSRCYHIRRGQLVWRTIDHTRVQMLLDSGEISEQEARSHPEAGMLTRALGHARMADNRPLVPDVLADPLDMEERDALILCSDGLHDLVEDIEIGQVVAGKTPEEAARALVELACDRGGHDNVTVAVVVAGKRSSEYDETFVPQLASKAETTYPGFAPEPSAAAPAFRGPGPSDDEPTEAGGQVVQAPPSSKKGLIIGVIVVLLLLGALGLFGMALAFGGWFMFA